MSYTPTNWQTGDTITAAKLNNMENGVKTVADAVDALQLGTLTLHLTDSYMGGDTKRSVPKSEVDAIIAAIPSIIRLEYYHLMGNYTTTMAYVLLSATPSGRYRYFSPESTSVALAIEITSSSFLYENKEYPYNSDTDCYEYTQTGGGGND